MTPMARARLHSRLSVIIVLDRYDNRVTSEEIAEKILKELERSGF